MWALTIIVLLSLLLIFFPHLFFIMVGITLIILIVCMVFAKIEQL